MASVGRTQRDRSHRVQGGETWANPWTLISSPEMGRIRSAAPKRPLLAPPFGDSKSNLGTGDYLPKLLSSFAFDTFLPGPLPPNPASEHPNTSPTLPLGCCSSGGAEPRTAEGLPGERSPTAGSVRLRPMFLLQTLLCTPQRAATRSSM